MGSSEGKTLIHFGISHYLINFLSIAVSIESNFVSEAERKDSFSIGSSHWHKHLFTQAAPKNFNRSLIHIHVQEFIWSFYQDK